MKSLISKLCSIAMLVVIAWSASTCGSATGPMTIDLTGTWSGSEADRLGPALLTWTLAQNGSAVSGTALIRPVDPTDGSCASCHKSKDGTLSGTLSGTTLMLTMFFPAGASADPTPACSITIISKGLNVAESLIAGTYSGSDPCEATFDGTLAMARKP